MRMKTLYKKIAIASAAFVAMFSIVPAWAYFTDTHEANGTIRIRVEPTTTIEEKYVAGQKTVVIRNLDTSDTPVFVRARVYASDVFTTNISAVNGWRDGDDGWYYYNKPLDVGDDTAPFVIDIPELLVENPDAIIDDLKVEANYNVIVIYESTPVQHKADGTEFANWDLKRDTVGDAS